MVCVTRWKAVPGLGWGQTAGRALGQCSELSQHRRARDTGPRECRARREALGAQQHAAPADSLGFARWPRRLKRAQQGRLTRVRAKWGGWQEPHSLPGREQREESPTRPPAPTPWALGERGAEVLGPGVEGGVALGEDPGRSGVRAGVQALSAPWLGGEPEDQHRAPPSCPPRPEGAPPGPGRSQRQVEHPLLLGSLGGPPGRRPGRGQAGGTGTWGSSS